MFRITYNSENRGRVFTVHTKKGIAKFIPHPKGYHYLDLEKCDELGLLMIMTVEENCKGHNKHEVRKAEEAWILQNMMGSPSQRDFEGMVHHNLIKNCPIDHKDVTNVYKIFGLDLVGGRGKMVRKKPERVVTDYVEIALEIRRCLSQIILTGDVMFVNRLQFFVTYGRDVGLLTVEFSPNWMAKQLGENLVHVVELYQRAGYDVETILMDMEFDKIKTILP